MWQESEIPTEWPVWQVSAYWGDRVVILQEIRNAKMFKDPEV
jgi:hypothetical protein